MSVSFSSFSSLFILFVLYFTLFFIFLVGGQPVFKAPTADQCLYFSDNNNVAKVLSYVNGTGGNNESGTLITTLINAGYFPNGITVYGEKGSQVLFVASERFISAYNVSNNLSRGPNIVNFAFFNESSCIPSGAISYGDLLYVSCSLTYSDPIISFSLRPGDNYSYVAGSAADLTYYSSFYQVAKFSLVEEGNYSAFDYAVGGVVNNITGPVGLATDNTFNFNRINLIPLTTNLTTRSPLSKAYTYIRNAGPVQTNEKWYGCTVGWDGNVYVVRNYDVAGKSYGDVLAFSGADGTFIKTFIQPSEDYANAVDIAVTPNLDFIVSIGNLIGQSYIYVFDRFTGARKGVFYKGSAADNINPQELYWGPCPSSPPPPPPEPGDDTTLIVLATVLPVLGALLLCLICCLILILIFLYVSRLIANRRRIYTVSDDLDRVEMGRRGKTVFTYREIDPDDLEIGQLLGQGAFGKVYKGTYRGAAVAIKTFDQIKLDEADEETLAEIREEAQMMERLGNHPNVINFVGAITNPSTKGHQLHFSLVTEFCPNGSLFDFLVKKKSKLSLVTLIKMARDIAAGILHLHREKVIHRDIAARNILVGNNYAVYISDFGMARIKQQDVNTTIANVGPVKWMAPECMKYKQYSEASDAFAYGVVLWEMLTRKVPWRGLDAAQVIIAVTEKNTRLKVPPDADPVLKKIIHSVWRENPEKRMPMAQIVSKLDTYLKTLEEVYEEMSSSDDDGTVKSEREYFRVESDSESRGGGKSSNYSSNQSKNKIGGGGSGGGSGGSGGGESAVSFTDSYSTLTGGTTESNYAGMPEEQKQYHALPPDEDKKDKKKNKKDKKEQKKKEKEGRRTVKDDNYANMPE